MGRKIPYVYGGVGWQQGTDHSHRFCNTTLLVSGRISSFEIPVIHRNMSTINVGEHVERTLTQ